MTVDAISALVRALSFIAMLQAAGIAIFIAVFGRHLERSAQGIARLGVGSAIAGAVLVVVHYLLEAGRMAGALSGVLDTSLQSIVLDSPLSTVAGLRLLGLLAIASTLRSEAGFARLASLVGTLCVVVSFAFMGHTADEARGRWLGVALVLHLLAVAFWFGGLAPLYRVSKLEAGRCTERVVTQFSLLATWIVPALFVCGLLLSVAILGRFSALAEPYGRLLLAKVAGFSLLMGLAALNKWRYGPRLESSTDANAAFRRSVAAEYLLVCGVLIATAVMTTFFSPSE